MVSTTWDYERNKSLKRHFIKRLNMMLELRSKYYNFSLWYRDTYAGNKNHRNLNNYQSHYYTDISFNTEHYKMIEKEYNNYIIFLDNTISAYQSLIATFDKVDEYISSSKFYGKSQDVKYKLYANAISKFNVKLERLAIKGVNK
jgi:hypothetical protein